MTTASDEIEESNLQCGLCLSKYKKPKLLPCHHTFCQSCLEDLVKSPGSFPLLCPICRETVKLPEGGVAGLKTNFYITPQLDHGLCKEHKAKVLEYFCQQCSTPLCMKCKLTDHEGHKTRDLDVVVEQARTELQGLQKRTEEAERTLSTHMAQIQDKITSCDISHKDLRQQVKNRVELLKQEFDSVLDECKKELLQDVDAALNDVVVPLQKAKLQVEKNIKTVQQLKQEMTAAFNDQNTHVLLAITKATAEGRGSHQQLEQLTARDETHQGQPVLQWDRSGLSRDVVKRSLGRVVLT